MKNRIKKPSDVHIDKVTKNAVEIGVNRSGDIGTSIVFMSSETAIPGGINMTAYMMEPASPILIPFNNRLLRFLNFMIKPP